MSKIPTDFEALELLQTLHWGAGSAMSIRHICREMDIHSRDFPKLLKKARELADKKNLNIMNNGNGSFYLYRQGMHEFEDRYDE